MMLAVHVSPSIRGRAALVAALRTRADQVFSRSAGAPLIGGNSVRILRDARENYPAWEQAIRDARSTIHVEMYIIHRDAVGRRFIDLLAAARARRRQGPGASTTGSDAAGVRCSACSGRSSRPAAKCASSIRRVSSRRSAGRPETIASTSASTAASRSSPDCASAGCGWAGRRSTRIRGATPAWKSSVPPSRTREHGFAESWRLTAARSIAAAAARSKPTSSRPATCICA